MVVIENYKIIKTIGKGSFGKVYQGIDLDTQEKVAIKLENSTNDCTQLLQEAKLYEQLSYHKHIPNVKWYGKKGKWNILILDYLGPSIQELLLFSNFKLNKVNKIAKQLIYIFEIIHIFGIIHRDIKPDNFLLGTGEHKNRIYLIDFGLSMSYIDKVTFQHIINTKHNPFVGSYRYSSIRNHLGYQQSRRDDLESLGYMIIYLAKGNLPWQGLVQNDGEELRTIIYKKKRDTSLQELCKGLPIFYYKYMKYCTTLKFDETPDYEYLKNLF